MVEVTDVTEDGSKAPARPYSSSVGMYESLVLRDGDPKEYNVLEYIAL
jgi:hypothetical protein